jgi:hypothetical protein
MTRPVLTPQEFGEALAAAGIFTTEELNDITRLVIDVRPGCLVTMHIQRVGDERLLDIATILHGARETPEQRVDTGLVPRSSAAGETP